MINILSISTSPKKKRRLKEGGFTLVEILVVITIMALIMSVVGPRVLNFLSESKVKAAQIQIESLASALDLYFIDTGRYPSTSEGLKALLERPSNVSGWSGPYLKGSNVPDDPWGRSYAYRFPGQRGRYEIVSYGADGREGGTGDAADLVSVAR